MSANIQSKTDASAQAYRINFEETIFVSIETSVFTRLNIERISFQYAKIIITHASIEIIRNGKNKNPDLATAENRYNFATNPLVGASPASAINTVVKAIT